ncbi:MAG: hypothetical protein ACE5G9_00775 [Nitrospinales bacterium]
MILKVWTDPASQSRIEGTPVSGAPKSLQKFSTKRKTYPASIVSRITGKNLFRKERVEFKTEQPVVVAAASAPALPPPEITVKGILLLEGTRIAVLEGHYSVHNDGMSIEKKAIKKKGYRPGDYIGDYQITAIEQNTVILSHKNGNQLIVKLKKRGSPTPIERAGNRLFYKPPKPGGAPKPAPVPTPAAIRARTAVTRAKPHISGNPQPAATPPPAAISGARTKPRQTKPHISGR